jgi:hypothetical protein
VSNAENLNIFDQDDVVKVSKFLNNKFKPLSRRLTDVSFAATNDDILKTSISTYQQPSHTQTKRAVSALSPARAAHVACVVASLLWLDAGLRAAAAAAAKRAQLLLDEHDAIDDDDSVVVFDDIDASLDM